jgi:hypothetical protein
MATTSDSPWVDHLFTLAPYRFQSGNAGVYTLLLGILADGLEQLLFDAFVFRQINEPGSPDDVLQELGSETGMPRFFGESADQHRERLKNRWETLPFYGQEGSLIASLEQSGFGDVTIFTDIPGTDVAVPAIRGGSAYDIQPYPPSSQWPSQFIVRCKLTADNIDAGTYSDMLSDKRLQTLRMLIRLIKPVDWVCREIILTYDTGSTNHFDDGHTFDGSIDWSAPSSTLVYERHRAHL